MKMKYLQPLNSTTRVLSTWRIFQKTLEVIDTIDVMIPASDRIVFRQIQLLSLGGGYKYICAGDNDLLSRFFFHFNTSNRVCRQSLWCL